MDADNPESTLMALIDDFIQNNRWLMYSEKEWPNFFA
jgi:hypothetical protein